MPRKTRAKAPHRPAVASSASIRTKMAKAKEEALAGQFVAMCTRLRLPEPVRELRFHAYRKWMFDYAWTADGVALEVQGGLFTQGRHTRGAALLKEHEKLNAAAEDGWRILYTTPDQLLDLATFKMIGRALGIQIPDIGAIP